MRKLSSPIIFLSGAGGGAPDFGVFRESDEDTTCFELIRYPGWKVYSTDGFSTEALIEYVVEQICARVPFGPIYIIGLSIGGHFGYAAALRLQAKGREIEGFCAIDTFMITSAKPSTGWKGRALAEGVELIRRRRPSDFIRFLRSKFWRALARLGGGRLPRLLRRFASSGRSSAISSFDPVFEEELSMRLLIETAAPWIGSLDREPAVLEAPAILLRTNLTGRDDAAWRRRCPDIKILEIPGDHHNLFEPENAEPLREAFVTATSDWR